MEIPSTSSDEVSPRLRALALAPRRSPAERAEVVSLLRAIATPRRRPADDFERFVFKVRGAFGKRADDPVAPALLTEGETARALGGALLEHDDGGRWTWSFHALDGVSDDDGVAWMRALAALREAPAGLLTLAEELFRARRRSVWMPAADALARAATRDESALATAARLWRDGQRPPPRELSKAARRERVHTLRHTLYLGLALAAAGGDVATLDPALDVDALLRTKLPVDASDASALLAGLARVVAARAHGPGGAEAFTARLAETACDPQQEDVLRALLTELSGDDARAPLCASLASTLRAPRWSRARGLDGLVDQLWSWLDTARTLATLGRHADLDLLRADAASLGVAPLVDLALRGDVDDADEVVRALRAVLDTDALQLRDERDKAAAIARLLLLGNTPRAASLPLQHAVALATRGVRPCPDVITTARFHDGLECLLIDHLLRLGRQCPKVLLRDRALPAEVVGRLVGIQSGAVAIQAAVQVAIGMQGLRTEARRVAELVRLSAAEPAVDFYEHLQTVLRGRDSPTHRACEHLAELARAAGDRALRVAARARLADVLREAAGGALELGPHGPITPELALSELERSIQRATALDAHTDNLEAWLAALQDVVFGHVRGRQGGLCYWSDWLRYGEERDDGEAELEAVWETLTHHLVDLVGVRGMERPEDAGSAPDGVQCAARDHAESFAAWRVSVDEALATLERPVESEEALARATQGLEELLRKASTDFPAQLRRVREETRARVAAMRGALERLQSFFSGLGGVERGMLREFLDDLATKVETRRRAVEEMSSARLRAIRGELLPTLRARIEARRAERASELAETALERAVTRARAAVRRDLHGWVENGVEAHVRALASSLDASRTLTAAHLGSLPGASDETRAAGASLSRVEGAGATLRLDAADCVLIGRFLLRHLLFDDARRFRVRVGGPDVNVPSVWSYFGPLLANLAGGTFLVLDVGTVWDQTLAEQRLRPGYWWVTATSLAAAFGLMYQGLAAEVPEAADGSAGRWRRGATLAARVCVPWTLALAFATTLAGFILWTLQGTDAYMGRHPLLQSLLWGSLSLFLGVFLNVTLQEKKLVRGDNA